MLKRTRFLRLCAEFGWLFGNEEAVMPTVHKPSFVNLFRGVLGARKLNQILKVNEVVSLKISFSSVYGITNLYSAI